MASFANSTYMLERVAAGRVPKASALYLTGTNPTPTTTFETLWDNSSLYVFLQANMATPTIVSSSANDAAAGTGARTVFITGVNSSYALQSETLTLNGTSTVNLVNSYMTINSMVVVTAGSGGTTAGNITIAAGGVTHGFILAGRNEAHSFIYCVPASYRLLMFDFFITEENASASGNGAQIVYSTNLGLNYIYGPFGFATNAQANLRFNVPLMFPAKTQIQAQSKSAAATVQMSSIATCVLLNETVATTLANDFASWM